jgi:uncharacterized membrane protein YphA (DoxX/SURF4 family)
MGMRMPLRVLLAGIFLYAGAAKLYFGTATNDSIYGDAPNWCRQTLPYGEILLGAWLLTPFRPRYAALVSILLLSTFTGFIASELRKAEPKPCGCAGVERGYDAASVRSSLKWSLLRNALFMGVAGYLFLSMAAQNNRTSTDSNCDPVGDPVPVPASD